MDYEKINKTLFGIFILAIILIIVYVAIVGVFQPFGSYEILEPVSMYSNATMTKEIPYWWFH